MSPVALALREVAFVAGASRTLDHVTLTLPEGARLAVTGVNGSGKSTLARIAAGLAAPLSGEVRLFGADPASLGGAALKRLRSRVSVAWQGGSLLGELTVEENLRLALGALHAGAAPRLRRRMDRLLVTYGLEGVYERPANALSVGEQRRLELARAFLREPDLLVLDEPLQGADAATACDLERALVRSLVRRPTALLLLTHDDALAARLCPEVLTLSGGRLSQAA